MKRQKEYEVVAIGVPLIENLPESKQGFFFSTFFNHILTIKKEQEKLITNLKEKKDAKTL